MLPKQHHIHTAMIMPQDNNLAEALKARNLLAEFDTSTETALPAPSPRGGAPLLLLNGCSVKSVSWFLLGHQAISLQLASHHV